MTYKVICDGDSITAGYGLEIGQDYPSRLILQLPSGSATVNEGTPGHTIADMDAEAPYRFDWQNTGPFDNFLVIAFGGTNDIAFGADATDAGEVTYSRMVTYCQHRRAAGWKVFVCTILPRAFVDASIHFEIKRQAVNTSFRGTWPSYADGLIDLAADHRIGDDGDQFDTTYYRNGDFVHPNAAGAQVIADLVAQAILAPVVPPPPPSSRFASVFASVVR